MGHLADLVAVVDQVGGLPAAVATVAAAAIILLEAVMIDRAVAVAVHLTAVQVKVLAREFLEPGL
jgi:phage terminase large subunit-like protein